MGHDSSLGRCHHVGVAVRDINRAASALSALFSAVPETDVVHDEDRAVRVKFMKLSDLRIELLEPAGAPSPLDSVLKTGIAIYHVCHEVEDLDAEFARLKLAGIIVLSPPKAAVALGGRRAAFVMCQGLMVELVEAQST